MHGLRCLAPALIVTWMCLPLPAVLAQPAQGASPVFAGTNIDPNPGPAGSMPYEMAGRVEPRHPLFDFDDVSRWVAEGTGVDVRLYRTAEQHLWRPFAAKVVYRSTGAVPNPSFVIRPVTPIPMPVVTALDESGKALPRPQCELRQGILHIIPGERPAFKFRLSRRGA